MKILVTSFTIHIKLISQSNNVRKITILRNRLFSLNGNNVTILESYHRFLEGFNLTHYQIPKDLSYLHLYKCLLSIFHEVVIWKNCCFTKWTINDLNATWENDRMGLQVSPFLVCKCVSYGLHSFTAKQQDGVFSFSTSND